MTRARVACSVLLAGCFHAPTPIARVHHGPAHGHVVDPIAALPVTCVSQGGPNACKLEDARAVAIATRMALEFAGYALVDTELLNAETRRRSIKTTGEETTIEKSGPEWKDLTPSAQRELLHSIGVHGVLQAAITMGPAYGAAQQRTVTVAVTVTRISDDALAWRSQCSVETGDYNAPERALDLAARCALESESMFLGMSAKSPIRI